MNCRKPCDKTTFLTLDDGSKVRAWAIGYLDSPRLHFRGWFQADVSTINNDVRMFQNASFVPEYQQLNQNGSWNPEGTAIFRILDCAVTGGFLHGSR